VTVDELELLYLVRKSQSWDGGKEQREVRVRDARVERELGGLDISD
jgi:hypothetical protein